VAISNAWCRAFDLLMSENEPELAFEIAERSRARILLEMLAESHLDIRKGVDPTLLDEERSLQAVLTKKSDQQIRVLNDVHASNQMKGLRHEIDELLIQ